MEEFTVTERESDLIEPKGLSWGLEGRLQFIDFRLRWEGRLNRGDLTGYFGISTPQSSLDIAKYTELAPDNLVYDRSARVYLASASFRPIYNRSSAKRYLAELLTTKMGVMEASASFIGAAPDIDWAPSPWRMLDEPTVEAVVKAILSRQAIEVGYQSMSSTEPSERWLSPHALGYDGFRWHVRAYCHKRECFRDFVVARILRVGGQQPSDVDPSTDTQWHTVITLELVPNPMLPAANRRVIELDYGMRKGQADLSCRLAFLYYTLRRLGLHTQKASDPQAQQIVLKNRDAIQSFIDGLKGG